MHNMKAIGLILPIMSLTTISSPAQEPGNRLNLYIDLSGCAKAESDSRDEGTDDEGLHTGFKAKQMRVELKGDITEKLFYRVRHRFNKSQAAQDQDNFALATDIAFVGWRFSDVIKAKAGKMLLDCGGWEYDENPLYIYQYSDFNNNIALNKAGVSVSITPGDGHHEITAQVVNSFNQTFKNQYPLLAETLHQRGLTGSNSPIGGLIGWNGCFLDSKLQTRWSYGVQAVAKGKNAQIWGLGQKLHLSKVQCYVDFMATRDQLDCLGYASAEAEDLLPGYGYAYFEDVRYISTIANVQWQFHDKWNLFASGMAEKAYTEIPSDFENFRHSYTGIIGVEYYPIEGQDIRVSVCYTGKRVSYDTAGIFTLDDYSTNRLEVGFMYHLQVFGKK